MVMDSYSVLSSSCPNQERTPAVVCAMSDDCPLVSVSEMSAKLEEECSYYPERALPMEGTEKDPVGGHSLETFQGLLSWRTALGTKYSPCAPPVKLELLHMHPRGLAPGPQRAPYKVCAAW